MPGRSGTWFRDCIFKVQAMSKVAGGLQGGRWGIVAAVCFLWAGAVRGDDWPQFRGPGRDGVWHESGILQTFPAGGLKVLWRKPVGEGWACPAVAEGRVVVTVA